MHPSEPAADPRLAGAVAIAERVARNCIPDLRGKPLYILEPCRDSLLTRELINGAGGLWRRDLDQTMKPELEAEGRWRGRGVAVVVDALAYFVLAENDDDALRSVVGATLHELCHHYDAPLEPARADFDHSPAAFVAACKRMGSPPVSSEFPPVLIMHSEEFCRLAAHCWYRTTRGGGVVLRPEHLVFGSTYPGLAMLPTPHEIIDVLWGELELLDGVALRRVAQAAPPDAYVELWDDCYMNNFSTPARCA